MTQEDKKLLLKDLSARLPFGVIVRHADPLIDNDGNETGEFWYKRGYLCDITSLDDMTTTIIESEGSDEEGYEHICFLEKTVPYLRPMSSMTEEEALDMYNLLGNYLKDEIRSVKIKSDGVEYKADNYKTFFSFEAIYSIEHLDWLNSHHFDYRGLIEKGLALEAPKGMYK